MLTSGKINLLGSKIIAQARSMLDNWGFKKVDSVYIYTEKPDPDNEGQFITVWTKVLPTPKIFLNYNSRFGLGGAMDSDSFTLTHVPLSYERDFLTTANKQGITKYYIIEQKAYIVTSIEKENFYWLIRIKRYISEKRNFIHPEEA